MPFGKRVSLMTGTTGARKVLSATGSGKVFEASYEFAPGLRTFDIEAQLIYSRDTGTNKYGLPWIAYKVGTGAHRSLAGTASKATLMQIVHAGTSAVYLLTFAQERRRIQVPASLVSLTAPLKLTVEIGVLLAEHSAVDMGGTIYVNRPATAAAGFTASTPIAFEFESYIQLSDIQRAGVIEYEEVDMLS